MNKALLAVLLMAALNANATKNSEGCQGNCPSTGGGPTSSESSAVGVGLGVGLGVGIGGDSSANVGDIKNTATGGAGGSALSVSEGGKGGDGGNAALIGSGNSSAQGGEAKAYGGKQSQGQHQSSTSGAVSGSKSIAQMASENTNRINASSANDNRSSANGNTTVTNVGGDSTLVERNAPPVFLGNLSATMSCSGGFNAGASDRNGSGAFGFTWISGDCRSVVIGREFVGIGMPDVACRVWKTTKGYKRAVKADPSLADVDCTIKPSPAPVVAPAVVAPELEPRIPRG